MVVPKLWRACEQEAVARGPSVKRWQCLFLLAVLVVAILIPMPEDAPKAREEGNTELVGTVMPEIGVDDETLLH